MEKLVNKHVYSAQKDVQKQIKWLLVFKSFTKQVQFVKLVFMMEKSKIKQVVK